MKEEQNNVDDSNIENYDVSENSEDNQESNIDSENKDESEHDQRTTDAEDDVQKMKEPLKSVAVTRNSLLKNFTRRVEEGQQTFDLENSASETNTAASGYNEALKGIQAVTNTIETINEKRKLSNSCVKPFGIEEEFKKIASQQNLSKLDDSEHLGKIIDEKINEFKESWIEEKNKEIQQIKQFIDDRCDELQEQMNKNRDHYESQLPTKSSNPSDTCKNEEVLRELEEKCQNIINKELKKLEERQSEKTNTFIETCITNIKQQLREEQQDRDNQIKSNVLSDVEQLKEEMRNEIEKIVNSKISIRETIAVQNYKEPKDETKEMDPDPFEAKLQTEMYQMKERLRNDFTKEVQALEDEIDALRKTYDSKGYTTDEGLGLSRSRLRLTEDSSEDELDRIIKQRQKKLQKSKISIKLHF